MQRHAEHQVHRTGAGCGLPGWGGCLLFIGLIAAAVASAPVAALSATTPLAEGVADAPTGARHALVPAAGSATIHLASAQHDEDVLHTLALERGKLVLLETEFRVKRVSIGDPKILDVVVLGPTEIQLIPKRAGSTNLVLWGPSGAPQAAIDVTIGTAHGHIQSLLRRVLDSEDIHVESAGDSIVVRGSVPGPVGAERAMAVARSFFPEKAREKVINLLSVGGNQQVMIEVIIAEMDRTLSHNMAVNWDTIIETGAKTFTFTSLIGGLTALLDDQSAMPHGGNEVIQMSPRVNLVGTFVDAGDFAGNVFAEFANIDGLAKILAQPTLIARSGQTANFLVGGEVPIPVAQGGAFGSISIEFKEFGVGVSFAPTVLGPERIYLEVSPEVSDVDFTLGTRIGDIITPGFRTRRASTTVELADGQSFAIAGLLRDDVLETIESYPGLGRIPVLGALFRSSKFQRNETELVLIVTTHLVKPLPRGPHPLPTDSFIEPGEAEFYLFGALESRSGTGHDAEEREEEPGELIGPAGHRIPITIERDEE
jgi:pilus assembly protein CpaC